MAMKRRNFVAAANRRVNRPVVMVDRKKAAKRGERKHRPAWR
jgi:hypothetical protein